MVKLGDTVEWELKRFGTQRGVVIGGEREGSERWRIKKDDGSVKFVFKDRITRVVPEKKKTVEEPKKKKTVEEPSSVPKKKKTVVKNKIPREFAETRYELKTKFGIEWDDWSVEGREKLKQVLIADKQRRIDEAKKRPPTDLSKLSPAKRAEELEIIRQRELRKKEREKRLAKKQKESNVKDFQSKMMAGDLDLEAKEWYDPQTGAEYMKVWDPEDNRWLITNPETNQGIGYLDKQGKLIKY